MSNGNPLGRGLRNLASMIDGLNDSGSDSSGSDTPQITLRYSTESLTLDAEDVQDKTVRQLFEENADELGLPDGTFSIRSSGNAVDPNDTPEAGRTYTASVSRESKGS